MGNQVDQLILGCILDATEHITQILVRVDVVGLAVCKDCQCPGKTGAAFGTTDEETIITVLRQPTYFPLDAII